MEQKKNLVNGEATLFDTKVEVVEGGAYKKVSELTREEIKKFPPVTVEFKRVVRNYNKQKNVSYYFRALFYKHFIHEEKISETMFYNIAYNVAPKIGLSSDLDEYKFNSYTRFVKGKTLNQETLEERDYLLCQCIITPDVIKSFFINKKDGKLDLFNTLVKKGYINVGKIVSKDVTVKKTEDSTEEKLIDLF